MTLIIDAGPLVAAVDLRDAGNKVATSFLAATKEEILVPDTVIGEVSYMVARRVGPGVESRLMRSFLSSPFKVIHVSPEDIQRACEIVVEYTDNPVGFVDASVVALAERLNVTRLATFDHRHFSVFRPRHCRAFELVP